MAIEHGKKDGEVAEPNFVRHDFMESETVSPRGSCKVEDSVGSDFVLVDKVPQLEEVSTQVSADSDTEKQEIKVTEILNESAVITEIQNESADIIEIDRKSAEITETQNESADVTETINESADVTETQSESADITETINESADVTETTNESADVTEIQNESAETTETEKESAEITETQSEKVAKTEKTIEMETESKTRKRERQISENVEEVFVKIEKSCEANNDSVDMESNQKADKDDVIESDESQETKIKNRISKAETAKTSLVKTEIIKVEKTENFKPEKTKIINLVDNEKTDDFKHTEKSGLQMLLDEVGKNSAKFQEKTETIETIDTEEMETIDTQNMITPEMFSNSFIDTRNMTTQEILSSNSFSDSFSHEKAIQRFLDWETKMLTEMNEGRKPQETSNKIQPQNEKKLELGSGKKLTYSSQNTETNSDFFERPQSELISIETSMKKLKCTTEVMTEAQFVKKLVSQGTSTAPEKPKKKEVPPKRGLQMLLDEIDKNSAKFVPEPEAEKKKRSNPLPWEQGMVSMMQDLKGSINRDSEHYKALKQGLLTTRKDFIKHQMLEEDDSSSSSDEEPRAGNLILSILCLVCLCFGLFLCMF